MDQHMKTLHITKENHAAIKDNIRGLENVISISLKDQERFISPWAVEILDGEKFERMVSLVGTLLRDDIQLQALYHMLVMMSPIQTVQERMQVSRHYLGYKSSMFLFQADQVLVEVQVKLTELIYPIHHLF